MAEDPISPVAFENIEVAVRTCMGMCPAVGYIRVPIDQKIAFLLRLASSALNIRDAGRWVARAGERELDPAISYRANGLNGRTLIHYNPAGEGGDGSFPPSP